MAAALALVLLSAAPAAAAFERVAGALDSLSGLGQRQAAGTARALSRAEALSLARTLPGAPVLAELSGGRLLLEAADGVRVPVALGEGFAARLDTALLGLAAAGGQPLVLTRDTARALGPVLEELPARASLRVAVRGFPPLPLRRFATPAGPRHLLELHPGLAVPLEVGIPEAAARILQGPVSREAIRVVPLLSATDADTLAALADAAGNRVVDSRGVLAGSGPPRLREMRDRILVVIGHVEGDAFVLRDAAGALERRIPFAGIERAAREADVKLLLSAGCGCFAAGAATGYLLPVTDLQIAASLRAALRARSQAELLASFGQPGNPYIITDDAVRRLIDDEALRLDRLSRYAGAAEGGSLALRVQASREAVSSAAATLRALAGGYALGVVSLALFRRHSRERFLRLFPVLPSPLFRPALYRLAWLGREAAFMTLGPLVGALALAVIVLGGWKERAELHEWGWSLFLSPAQFLLDTTWMLVRWVLLFAIVCVLSVPVALLFILVPMETLRQSWAMLLAFLLMLGTGYSLKRVLKRSGDLIEAALASMMRRWPRVTRMIGMATPLLLGTGVMVALL